MQPENIRHTFPGHSLAKPSTITASRSDLPTSRAGHDRQGDNSVELLRHVGGETAWGSAVIVTLP